MESSVIEVIALAEGRIRVTTRIATTHPISAYGGFELSEGFLERLADGVRSGAMPLTINHDAAKNLNAICLGTEIVELTDGFKALDADFEVDAGPWREHHAELSELGVPGGMSYSFTSTVGWFSEGDVAAEGPRFAIFGDASHFADEDLVRAGEQLAADHVTTEVGRIYQFSSVHACRVIVEFVYQSDGLQPAVVAVQAGIQVFIAGAVEAVKSLFHARRAKHADMSEPLTVEVRRVFHPDGTRVETYKVSGTDEEAVLRALVKAGEPMESEHERKVAVWDDATQSWLWV